MSVNRPRLLDLYRLWNQAKVENRRLRSELHQMRVDLAVAYVQYDQAKARARALEAANDGLRADLSSWMDKAVSSDG